jgi:hypothetical protein
VEERPARRGRRDAAAPRADARHLQRRRQKGGGRGSGRAAALDAIQTGSSSLHAASASCARRSLPAGSSLQPTGTQALFALAGHHQLPSRSAGTPSTTRRGTRRCAPTTASTSRSSTRSSPPACSRARRSARAERERGYWRGGPQSPASR